MILLAVHFNNVETLSVQLRLTPADRQEAKDMAFRFDIRTGVDKALRLWRKVNPGAATYRALVEIVLGMGVNGTAIAEEVCKFLKCECSIPLASHSNVSFCFPHNYVLLSTSVSIVSGAVVYVYTLQSEF